MTQFQQWSLAITPLSPVHLGTGQDYEPSGYVIDEGALYEFDGISALQALPDAERERLAKILDGRPTQDMLLEVQRFFHGNRERLIPVAINQVRVNPTVEAFYGERVGTVAQEEQGGRRVQNKLEIQRTAYNPPSRRPIVPGSGLKGAIRTALLDAENSGQGLRQVPDRRTGQARKENNQELQNRLFRFRPGKFELDPMRLIHLTDAAVVDGAGFATEVRFAVNRKKRPVMKNDVLIQSQAEQQNLYQLLECLPGMQPRAFSGSLSIQRGQGFPGPKWPELRFDLPEIAAACNAFYRRSLDREISLLCERGYLDELWDTWLRELLAGPIGQAIEKQRAFLLRVGRHSGAESVTLEGVRDIRIMMGRDPETRRMRSENLPAAKTLWLATDERQSQRNLLPFGWLLVEPYQDPAELPQWPATARDLGVAGWRAAVESRKARLRAEAAEAERRRAEREAEEQEVRRAEDERTARLASLSEEGRKLEGLRTLLARDSAANRKEAGGELANQLVSLLKEAGESWSGPDCVALADLALEVYGFIGWPASKKKQQRQAQIEALRSKANLSSAGASS
jgi:CRISPR-associated protein Csm5